MILNKLHEIIINILYYVDNLKDIKNIIDKEKNIY